MALLVVDVHEKAFEEADKIYRVVENYSKTGMLRLFDNKAPIADYDLSLYDGVIISGSDKYDLLESREVGELKKKILEAVDKNTNFLGICAGKHILAECFGYKVVELRPPEVGWPKVSLTEQGKKDPLFHGMPEVIRPFQVHIKQVEGVEDGKILAKNRCLQAAQYYLTEKSVVYGIQGHAEEAPISGEKFLEENPKYRTLSDGRMLSMSAFRKPEKYVEWKILKNFTDIVKNKL